MREIVFADLDGTVLDLKNYSAEKAIEGINILKLRGISIVPASGKTRAEMLKVREELKIGGPFIYENGAGICFGENGSLPDELLSPSIAELSSVLQRLSATAELKLISIIEMTDEETADYTGLSIENARLARQRIGSLPFIVSSEKTIDIGRASALNQKLSGCQYKIIKGGKFYHLVPEIIDKRLAAERIIAYMKAGIPCENFFITAIGDGENDLPMLSFADRKIFVGAALPDNLHTDVIITAQKGPAGFTEAVKKYFKDSSK